MLNYSLVQSVKVLAGRGTINNIGQLLNEAGYKKAFLVYDEGMKTTGIIDRIIENIKEQKIEYVLFDRVQPDPPAEIVNLGGRLCKETKCDCVIGIGGGSSIDAAKCINILRFNEGDILDYTTKHINKCNGLITIPTTSGTGSELSNGAIISDVENNVKVPLPTVNSMSEYTILDPELTIGMPIGLTVMTGLDVFSHAAEAYTSVLNNVSIDLICEKILETVVEYLPLAAENGNNIEAREKMQIAASLGGWMLYNAAAHVGHSIAHVIGSTYHLPHGLACAYGFPSMVKFISEATPNKVKNIGKILGAKFIGNETNYEIGEITARAYIEFTESLGLKPIKDYNLDLTNIDILVESIVNEPFAGLSPLKVTKESAELMIKETLDYYLEKSLV